MLRTNVRIPINKISIFSVRHILNQCSNLEHPTYLFILTYEFSATKQFEIFFLQNYQYRKHLNLSLNRQFTYQEKPCKLREPSAPKRLEWKIQKDCACFMLKRLRHVTVKDQQRVSLDVFTRIRCVSSSHQALFLRLYVFENEFM